jgi:hypothetical protein
VDVLFFLNVYASKNAKISFSPIQCLSDSRLKRFQVALVTGSFYKGDIEVTLFLVKRKVVSPINGGIRTPA